MARTDVEAHDQSQWEQGANAMTPEENEQLYPSPAKRPRAGKPPVGESQTVKGDDEFFDLLQKFPDSDWTHNLSLYVWRRDPWTDTTNGGRDTKYIDVCNRPLTREDMKKLYGSGTYKLWLKRGNDPLYWTVVPIEHPDFPPFIPPGDWMDHPKNNKWRPWKPIIEKWWREKMEATTQPKAATITNGDANPLLIQFLNEVRNDIRDLRRHEAPARQDPITASLITVLPDLMEKATKAQSKETDPVLMKMLDDASKRADRAEDQRREDLKRYEEQRRADAQAALAREEALRKEVSTLTTSIMQRANEPPSTSAVQQIEGYGKGIEAMTNLMATLSDKVGPAEPLTFWQELARGLAPGITTLAAPIIGRILTPTPPANFVRPNQPGIAPTQPPNPANPSPPAAPDPANSTAPTSEEQFPMMDSAQAGMIIKIAMLASTYLEMDRTGDEFAEDLKFKYGDAAYRQITMFPKEQLIAVLKGIPQAWPLLAPFEAQIPAFLEQFYNPGEHKEEDDDGITPEVLPPLPEKPRSKAKAKKSR